MNTVRSYAVRFFLTRPLTAFVGFALGLQARSSYKTTQNVPRPALAMLSMLGFAAVVVACGVLLIPKLTHRPPSVKPRQWMGWVLILYFVVRGTSAAYHASKVATGPLSWIDNASGLWGWSIIGAFGVLLVVAPLTNHLWGEDAACLESNKPTHVRG